MTGDAAGSDRGETQRDRLEAAALQLLEEHGPAGVTTRAVSAAAGVQPMAIYRTFGDMEGLLEAATLRGFEEYLRAKRDHVRVDDPVDDLRWGWDLHVRFGVTHPHVYVRMYGRPEPGKLSPAVQEATEELLERVEAVARAGRLLVGTEAATRAYHAAGCGTTLTLISIPPDERDPELSIGNREAILAAITTDAQFLAGDDRSRYAVALKATLVNGPTVLADAEHALLVEWLDRLAAAGSTGRMGRGGDLSW